MAHEVETMAYAGETPWHGLGVRVPSTLSPEEMLKVAGLDWRVDKFPSWFEYEDSHGNTIRKKTGDSALVRLTDMRVLSTVSDNWMPLQNHKAFELFDEFTKAGDMEMHTAGSLKTGKFVWALAKVRDGFRLFNGDEVESYLLLTNPHKYGHKIDIRFTPIRVVCNNTLTMALKGRDDVTMSATHHSELDLNMVKETLGLAKKKMTDYKEAAEFLGSKKAAKNDVLEFFLKLFPASEGSLKSANDNIANRIALPGHRAMALIETQPGANYAAGSWWPVLNSVTRYLDHEAGRSADTRLHSAWYGAARRTKIKALNLAMDYAKAA